jgi:hypothetical protein
MRCGDGEAAPQFIPGFILLSFIVHGLPGTFLQIYDDFTPMPYQ